MPDPLKEYGTIAGGVFVSRLSRAHCSIHFAGVGLAASTRGLSGRIWKGWGRVGMEQAVSLAVKTIPHPNTPRSVRAVGSLCILLSLPTHRRYAGTRHEWRMSFRNRNMCSLVAEYSCHVFPYSDLQTVSWYFYRISGFALIASCSSASSYCSKIRYCSWSSDPFTK